MSRQCGPSRGSIGEGDEAMVPAMSSNGKEILSSIPLFQIVLKLKIKKLLKCQQAFLEFLVLRRDCSMQTLDFPARNCSSNLRRFHVVSTIMTSIRRRNDGDSITISRWVRVGEGGSAPPYCGSDWLALLETTYRKCPRTTHRPPLT